MSEQQNYSNHARYFPLFHFVVIPILTLNLLWRIFRFYQLMNLDSAWNIFLALALILLAIAARLQSLRAQDRAIRIEEQLRYKKLLSPELAARSAELKIGQIIALRFASDEELPELMDRTLKGEFEKNKEIKQAVKHWRADHLRV